MNPDFLTRMGLTSRARARAARAGVPESALLAVARATPAAPPLRLTDFDVIAEIKLRSPAAGALATGSFDRGGQVEAYARAGAAAISVLTEPTEFHGDLDHLAAAAAQLRTHGCPAMRKDFLTDPYQILEARAAGAGGVLLIVGLLTPVELDTMLACAAELEMFVLLEAFDVAELARIAALDLAGTRLTVLAGVNCRDLRSLAVDFRRFAELAPHLPPRLACVAESGIATPDDVRSVVALGYRLALVGSALMRTRDPGATLADLLAAGRAAHAESAACS